MAKISAMSFDIFFESSAGGAAIRTTASTMDGAMKMGTLGAFAGAWPKKDVARQPNRMVLRVRLRVVIVRNPAS
jgi:hypothetical protein